MLPDVSFQYEVTVEVSHVNDVLYVFTLAVVCMQTLFSTELRLPRKLWSKQDTP